MFNLYALVHDNVNSGSGQQIGRVLVLNIQLHPENFWLQA
jgi:hypothetical protein